MTDHKTRAKTKCMAACNAVACQCADACAGQQFDPLLGAMPAWWDYLPDGGGSRRDAFADLLGRAAVRAAKKWSAQR